ncbi:MAG: hypothetical protein GX939_05870 [Clostridiaceae bacterium]|nr:hypothetical protein [Clostridiaceae bacterium]
MNIGLAVYTSQNNDIAFNIGKMEEAFELSRGKVDLLCFGESFLQGFDALSWNIDDDIEIAVAQDSDVIQHLCELTLFYKTDLLFGYFEKEDDTLYSSCALLERGKLFHNYRRISAGWKVISKTDEHYQEGTDVREFLYRGKLCNITLCGDLWEFPERFMTNGLLLWPIYVNFSLEEWHAFEQEYADQAYLAASRTLMVNVLSNEPTAHGGAFDFRDGHIAEQFPYDKEGILIVSV